MPRLSNTEYLIRHAMIRSAWRADKRYFSLLTYKQQRDLLHYFRPDLNGTDDVLLQHRIKVTKQDPSLPHRAAKAFLVLLRSPSEQPATRAKAKPPVRPLAKPEIDVVKLTEGLMDLVGQMPPAERRKLTDDSRRQRNAA